LNELFRRYRYAELITGLRAVILKYVFGKKNELMKAAMLLDFEIQLKHL
jgi:hypothetical protein